MKDHRGQRAVRIGKILTLLALIVLALAAAALLLSFLPMAFMDGDVQLDSGGFLDLLLRRTQHASAVIPAKLVFLGALPMVTEVLLLLADTAVLFHFFKKAKKSDTAFFPGGGTHWVLLTVCAAATAAVPTVCSAAVKTAVAESGTFAAKAWNPLGSIVLFALVLICALLYFKKQKAYNAVQDAPQEV